VSSETDLVAPEVREMDGTTALPRSNGELVFSAPWEGRAFGMAVDLVRHLGVDWEEFRRRLIAAIADDSDRPYYESWTAAIESLAVDYGVVTEGELEGRAESIRR
jgi:nitrile hydratase accessory protein